MPNLRSLDTHGETRRGRDSRRASAGALIDTSLTNIDTVLGDLLHAQDEEYRRVARSLHDRAGQSLSALSMNLSMLLSQQSALDVRTRAALMESLSLADSAMEEIRMLSYQLHPPLLDELGLPSALHSLVERFGERTGIDARLSLPDQPERLPQSVEIALFRIAQEALENVRRHSGCGVATVRLQRENDHVQLAVEDNGCGLLPELPEGTGIPAMQVRVRRMGGMFTIASSAKGTTLLATIPVAAQKTKAKSA